MSINKPPNYSFFEKPSSRFKRDNDEITTDPKRHTPKKDDDNQNNRWSEDRHNSYHRSRPLSLSSHKDVRPRYKYQSYDYRPTKYSCDDYKSPRYSRTSMCHEFTDSADNYDDYHRSHNRTSRPYVSGHYSSNEDLENSRTLDYSSDNSRKYSYRSSNQNYGDVMRGISRDLTDRYKYSGTSRYNEDFDTEKYRSSYNPGSYNYTASPQRSKRTSFSTNFTNYANNNRSDPRTKMKYSPRLHSDDNLYSKRMEDTSDKYSRRIDDGHNAAQMRLKSFHRRDENVPHSGTRLDTDRKYVAKRYVGRGNRYNESNNTDRLCQDSKKLVNKCTKTSKCVLPQTPKRNSLRKPYVSDNNSYDSRNRLSLPRRTNCHSHHRDFSPRDNYYFENGRNSNNGYASKQHSNIRDNGRDDFETISDNTNSSSAALTHHLYSTEPNANITSVNSTYNELMPKSIINHSPKKNRLIDLPYRHRPSCRSLHHHRHHKQH